MRAWKPLLVLSIAAVACGSCKKDRRNNPPPPPPPPGAAVDRIEVTPAATSIEVEQTAQLAGRALDMNGNALARMLVWSSANEAVATVGNAGLVRAVAVGTAMIRAT